MSINNYTLVKLITDRYKEKTGIGQGRLGTVIEVYPSGDYEVDFSYPLNNTSLFFSVKADEVQKVEDGYLDLLNEDQIEFEKLNEDQLERLALGADQFVATSALSELNIRFKFKVKQVADKILVSPLSDHLLMEQAKEIIGDK